MLTLKQIREDKEYAIRRLAVKGVNEFTAYIPPGSYPGYSIDYEQLESLFSLL